jgi:hypothetical protein
MLTKLLFRPRVNKRRLETLLSRPWNDVVLSPEVTQIPTMLSQGELQVLHWLARHHFRGIGRIVDGGCFLGGSTAALASGLAARSDGPWKKAIAAYDLFRVEPYTLANFQSQFSDPTVGASFRRDFDRFVAPWSPYVDVCEGDVAAIGWNGKPIEILFLDFIKKWKLNDFVLERFFPRLIPGHSVIVQQDYMWGCAPWIHITMELLAPYVTVLDSMLCSVVYLLTSPIPKRLFGLKIRTQVPPETQMQLMDQAVSRWTGQQRGLVELAKVFLIREIQSSEAAQEELQHVLARYPGDELIKSCADYLAVDIVDGPWWMAD